MGEQSITLGLTGDVMLGRGVDETLAERGPAHPWGDMLQPLREADLLLVNLECALTSHRRRWHDGEYKSFYFRADPEHVAVLREARVAFAGLANNHTLDFGLDGLLETLRVLDDAGIAHAGAGPTLAAARAPARLAARGLRVNVVAFADYPLEWAAGPDRPGINYTPVSTLQEDFLPIESALAQVREGADLVVFSIHWGPNMSPRPAKAFQVFAHRIIEAGADIFWGHSAHLVQGIEFHQGRPVLYDTGDFVDDYAVDPVLRNDLSALFVPRATRTGVQSVELIPVRISEQQANRAVGEAREWFVRRMSVLCREMDTEVTATSQGCSVTPLRAPSPVGGTEDVWT